MKIARYSNILFILLLIILLTPVFTFGQSASEIRKEIENHNAQIEALNKEIAGYEKQLTEIGTQKQTLKSTLSQIDLSRKKISASINVTKNKIGALQLEIQNLSKDIESAEGSIDVNQMGLAESLRRIHEVDSQKLVFVMLAAANMGDLWEDIDGMRTLQNAVRDDIAQLTVQKASLTETKASTEEKQAELVAQQRNLTAQQGSLDATRRAQSELLAQTQSKESTYQSILAQKQAAKASFEQALEDLESKLEYTLDPSRLPSAGKGILRWPLDNVFVTQQFGRTSDSGRLYSSGTHNGVDFRASVGTPVKAALSGTITATGNTDAVRGCYSYGKWVLIKHGNGLSTLYAHLSQINVSSGESVSTREVIGYSGSTGYATGPHLHFTVYASDAVQVRPLGSGKGCNAAVMPVSAQTGYLNPMDYL